MTKCQVCGKEQVLPFKCEHCGKLFCAEHRHIGNHYCSFLDPKTIKRGINRNVITQGVPQASNDLIDYALGVINADRRSNNLREVTLSHILCAQQHAQDMLTNHYFSHWNTKGLKPYMRYTLAGGKGAVAENIAWQTSNKEYDFERIKNSLKKLQWQMMFDDADSNWGHRETILEPRHNKVSIGIAYDNFNVYFVEDFEQDTINLNLTFNGEEVIAEGYLQQSDVEIKNIAVFYDKPVDLATKELCNPPYNGPYGPGKHVALILQPNFSAPQIITITAKNWVQKNHFFRIFFSLKDAVSAYGNGVYTLYLVPGNNTKMTLTTFSVWVS
jgi:uncharacterized protein YkwD